MLGYSSVFIILFVICLFCTIVICYTSFQTEPKNRKVRNLGRKFKVVTGPQTSEIILSPEKKKELQMLVENVGLEVHEFIKNANHFYFVIKHVFSRNPEPFLFCSKETKKEITTEMTHNSSIENDFLAIPLEFNQLYLFLSSL